MFISYNTNSYTMLSCLLLMNVLLNCFSSPLKLHNISSTHLCHTYESLALLQLTIDDYDESPYPVSPKTKSWRNDTDCCKWEGIKCDNDTHHVIAVNLRSSGIKGSIHSNSSIFLLHRLQYLSLSQNDMSVSAISPKFGEFRFLKHLDLSASSFRPCSFGLNFSSVQFSSIQFSSVQFSSSLHKLTLISVQFSSVQLHSVQFSSALISPKEQGLSGKVPSEIAQLTQLRYLDLSQNANLNMPNFAGIIVNLTELRHVDISFVNVNDRIPKSLVNLSSLTFLGLSECQLQGELPVDILTLTHLKFLDISDNYVYSNVKLFHNWNNSLEYLDLSFVNFSSSLPPFLQGRQPHQLSVLRLEQCNMHGLIPTWVWNTSQQIDLGSNYLTSPSADFLSKITTLTLVQLALDDNNLHGNISLYDDILSKLPNLQGLMLSNSGLSVTLTNGPILTPHRLGLIRCRVFSYRTPISMAMSQVGCYMLGRTR
ncbi:hypothetical protein RND81_09G062800 [Saponaria officinalis]|uniref:Leucine-rich repeat-containing N-terminal plant-type domain-containing protein n=1 Tax=Saponaria officinalis TaxID=3572 RepID=A0AAW1IJG7_SAPOF